MLSSSSTSSDLCQDILDQQHPAQVVDIALEALQKDNISVVEWRSLLYRRMNVPLLIIDYSYLIPDDDFNKSLDILSRIGLSLLPPSKSQIRCVGDLAAKGHFYRISPHKQSLLVQNLAFYPLSFSTLSISELTEEPPWHIQPSRCTHILVPRPSAVLASIIRMSAKYSQHCVTRLILMSDLSDLFTYYLMRLMMGSIEPLKWEDRSEDESIAEGLCIVKQWTCDHEWLEGEEWIGDVLAALFDEFRYDDIPYTDEGEVFVPPALG